MKNIYVLCLYFLLFLLHCVVLLYFSSVYFCILSTHVHRLYCTYCMFVSTFGKYSSLESCKHHFIMQILNSSTKFARKYNKDLKNHTILLERSMFRVKVVTKQRVSWSMFERLGVVRDHERSELFCVVNFFRNSFYRSVRRSRSTIVKQHRTVRILSIIDVYKQCLKRKIIDVYVNCSDSKCK